MRVSIHDFGDPIPGVLRIDRIPSFAFRTRRIYASLMERTIHIHPSHEAAAAADSAAMALLTPQQRLDRALVLCARYREGLGDAGQGFARIARIVPFKPR
jgi:hypothetical protein